MSGTAIPWISVLVTKRLINSERTPGFYSATRELRLQSRRTAKWTSPTAGHLCELEIMVSRLPFSYAENLQWNTFLSHFSSLMIFIKLKMSEVLSWQNWKIKLMHFLKSSDAASKNVSQMLRKTWDKSMWFQVISTWFFLNKNFDGKFVGGGLPQDEKIGARFHALQLLIL